MAYQIGLTDVLVWGPVLMAAVLFGTARLEVWHKQLRHLPLLVVVLLFGVVGYLWLRFDSSVGQMQFANSVPWLPQLGINYALGVDGISLVLLALTAFMNVLVILTARGMVATGSYVQYMATFMLMQGLMNGVFLALDAVLFYVFFEAMMIPMFLIIGIWGGERRIYATFKFILYTFAGSLLLLVAILYLGYMLGVQTGAQQFSINSLQTAILSLEQQKWLFWAFLLAFAVKIPMWPVHTWLPDAHVEAPTGGSVILAAITLKMGAYGMLRFLLPCVPLACAHFAHFVIVLSLIAIVYVGLVAIVQKDLKKLIAYSSIAHMGFVTLGLFLIFGILQSKQGIAEAQVALSGALMQMLSHGFVSGGLFLCVGILYVRMHTRLISDFGGIAKVLPGYAVCFMVFALANVGMPGTSGFIGEFLVILSSMRVNFWYALLAGVTVILSVAYTLWMYKRVVFGGVKSTEVAQLHRLRMDEKLALMLLVGAIVLFGVWPAPVFEVSNQAIKQLVLQISKGIAI